MAEALLRARLEHRIPPVVVGSAGLRFDGRGPERGAIRAMARRGIDIGGARSQIISAEMLEQASLVLGMERYHVREVAALRPDRFARTYTIVEFVEDAEVFGPRGDEPLSGWVERIGRLRTIDSYAGTDPASEVADPMGRSGRFFRTVADQLEALVDRLAFLAWPPALRPGSSDLAGAADPGFGGNATAPLPSFRPFDGGS